MKARRLLLAGPRRLQSDETELLPDTSHVIVDVSAWGICNSEMGDWKGAARAYPCTIGHEWAGVAVQVGRDVHGIQEGDIVTGFGGGGLADFIRVPGADCFRLSPRVDPLYGMCEPLKCVVTVLRAAHPEPGDVGVVLGCGAMGLWCIQALAGNMLSALVAVDTDDSRLDRARARGATHAVNPGREDASALIGEVSAGRMADFIIEGTGSSRALNQGVEWLKTARGRLTLLSMYEDVGCGIYVRDIMNKGVEIRGVFPVYSSDERDDMVRAIALLERGVLTIRDLVTHRCSLDAAADGLFACELKSDNYVKGIIVP